MRAGAPEHEKFAPKTAGDVSDQLSLRLYGQEPGKHGGLRLWLERIPGGPSNPQGAWSSSFNISTSAPQGDPRWFLRIFGERAAGFFGFREELRRQGRGVRAWSRIRLRGPAPWQQYILAPDGSEMAGAIKVLNHLLPEKDGIPITFYRGAHLAGRVGLRFYLTQFRDFAALPIAVKPPMLFHDVAWHTASIVHPNAGVIHARGHLSIAIEFVDWLLTQFPEDSSLREEVLAFEEAIYNQLATQVDAGTGNLGPYTILAEGDSPAASARKSSETAYNIGYRIFVADGVSPNARLQQLVAGAERALRGKLSEQEIDIFRSAYALYGLHYSSEWGDRTYKLLTLDEFCLEVRRKRELIRTTAESLF